MSYPLRNTIDGGRFGTFIDDAGNPPCDPPDGCRVCVLFSIQRPNETRAEWISRIAPTPDRRIS